MAEIKVYRFGARWHWRCDRRGKGRCRGGPKKTQPEAFTAAVAHYEAEHRQADAAAEARYVEWQSREEGGDVFGYGQGDWAATWKQ